MNNIPRVSIIIPCYGVEKYLNRCVESIVNQTLKNIEIILIDDGSLDNVPQMCDEWVKKDDRIKVIHKRNAGLGFARNSGLEVARGEYIAFVDSDDYVDLTMYEVLYNEASFSNADAVFCGFKTEKKPGIWIESKEVLERSEFKNKEQVQDFMLDMIACASHIFPERKYQMSVWHSIYRRSLINNNGISFLSEREVVSEDIPFQIDFLNVSTKVVYLPQEFYYYCLNGTSLTATYIPEKYDRYKVLRTVLISKLKNIKGGKDRINRLFIGYVRSNLLTLLSSDRKDKKEILNHIVSDEIWNTLRTEYQASNLPLYARIIYLLICNRQPQLLRLFVSCVSRIKKVVCRNRN